MQLEGKVAIVTGAGSGIGAATATRFAAEGAKLVLNDANADYLAATVAGLAGAGHRSVVGSVADEATAERLAGEATSAFGRIDVLVNNAGKIWVQDVTDTTSEDWDEVMDTNLKSMFLNSKHVLPTMLAQKSGSIVNLASVSSFIAQEFDGVSTYLYNVTKAAVAQLTRSLASRYALDGIRVNAVAPGATKTRIIRHLDPSLTDEQEEEIWEATGRLNTPIGRVGRADEIAASILFLASDEASFVTGAVLPVDGGFLLR